MIPRTVILAPHHDDVALFTAFNAIRHKAHIVVVFRSVKQEQCGITDETRRLEEEAAAAELGCTVEFWDYPDDEDLEREVLDIRIALKMRELDYPCLFAPAHEDEGGNAQHNLIAEAASSVYREVTQYLTYTTEGKSTWGHRVDFEPAWVPMKLRALACHVSQASLPNCMEHFLRDQHEYVA